MPLLQHSLLTRWSWVYNAYRETIMELAITPNCSQVLYRLFKWYSTYNVPNDCIVHLIKQTMIYHCLQYSISGNTVPYTIFSWWRISIHLLVRADNLSVLGWFYKSLLFWCLSQWGSCQMGILLSFAFNTITVVYRNKSLIKLIRLVMQINGLSLEKMNISSERWNRRKRKLIA